MSGASKVVCVTRATGFIASCLVKLLLQHRYIVKASVRDPNDSKKIEHLVSLEGAKERLQLIKANLLEEGSFDAVVNGCEGVFHTASPVVFSSTDPKKELLDPAVKGTLNLLRSCTKVPSVKRVVLTSSMAAVMYNGKPFNDPNVVVDETWFSDPVYCEELKSWYALSKFLAEKAAWEFAKENQIDLVTLLPTFVIGPILSPTLSPSVEMILNQMNAETFPNRVYSYVDVRDVALAHVQAFEVASASGRYCLVGHVVHISEVMKISRELYPTLSVPQKCEDDNPPMTTCKISNEKAMDLVKNFIPLELSLSKTIETLKEKGFLNFQVFRKMT